MAPWRVHTIRSRHTFNTSHHIHTMAAERTSPGLRSRAGSPGLRQHRIRYDKMEGTDPPREKTEGHKETRHVKDTAPDRVGGLKVRWPGEGTQRRPGVDWSPGAVTIVTFGKIAATLNQLAKYPDINGLTCTYRRPFSPKSHTAHGIAYSRCSNINSHPL